MLIKDQRFIQVKPSFYNKDTYIYDIYKRPEKYSEHSQASKKKL